MQTQSTVASRWKAVATLAVVIALVTAWIVMTDRAGATSAPVTPVAQHSDVLGDMLALQFDSNGDNNIFAKYEGIDGEFTGDPHANWSMIHSIEWGAQLSDPSVGVRGGGRSEPTVNDFVLTFTYDSAVPKLAEKLLEGEVIPTLEVELTTGGDTDDTYLRYEMTGVVVTDYAILGTAGEGRARVAFANSFEKIEVTYTEFFDNGTVKGTVTYEYP